MSVALYARVSTARQAEKDLSIPDQLKQMRAYCERQGWTVAEEYIEEGASATTDRRPVFQQMIAEACTSPAPFQFIVVHSLSRFFRDAIESGLYERRLQKYGVRLISITQQTTDDPAGMLARRIFSVFDEYQSVENSKHTLRSMLENARQGYWNGAPPPYGYRAVDTESKGRHGRKKRLDLEPAEAETVRLIYDLYSGKSTIEPLGLKGIAAHLNARGQLRRGKRWQANQVHTVLTHSVYLGELHFNQTCSKTREIKPRDQWVTVAVPPIVTESARACADIVRAGRAPAVTPPRQLTSPLLLAGIVRCGICGAGMTLATGKGGQYRYYKCSARISKGPHACTNSSLPVDKLDKAVLDAVAQKVLEPARLSELLKALQRRIKASASDGADRLARLRRSPMIE